MINFFKEKKREPAVLLIFAFVISAINLFYELLISSISSYFLGSSIFYFSITIGIFMFFMGIGSYLSKFIHEQLFERLVLLEIIVAFIGGISGFLLYFSFSFTEYYYLSAFLLIAIISLIIGFEIPLATRLLKQYSNLKNTIAHLLAFDYLGALIASLVFPLVIFPYFGGMKTSFLIGMLNMLVAFFLMFEFKSHLRKFKRYFGGALMAMAVLIAGFIYSFQINNFFESFIYQDQIVYATQTPYQRLVVTKFNEDTRLFINGNLQFSSVDEYRYHEALVHIPMSLAPHHEQVLVLGGGDGLAVREILKYKDVGKITLVDIDPQMTDIAKNNPIFSTLNKNSFQDSKVEIIHEDAYKFIENSSLTYSVIIVDLPDPNDLSLGKLYTKEFYSLLKKRLAQDGIMVTQSTSPYFARQAFWSINKTLHQTFPDVIPYTVYVPSFGQWGFNLAGNNTIPLQKLALSVETKYLSNDMLTKLFLFEKDMAEVPTEINTLDNQILVQYYENSWDEWN